MNDVLSIKLVAEPLFKVIARTVDSETGSVVTGSTFSSDYTDKISDYTSVEDFATVTNTVAPELYTASNAIFEFYFCKGVDGNVKVEGIPSSSSNKFETLKFRPHTTLSGPAVSLT